METVITNEQEVHERARKSLLWVAIVSMVMFFGAFASGYIVRMESGNWLHFELPKMFYISTAIILLSSATINWALSAAKGNNLSAVKKASGLTLLLGISFMASQFLAWTELYEGNIVFAGNQSNASGSFLYALTGLHLLHLVFGFFAVFVVWVKALREKYNAENYLGIKLCAIFWHFLDGLWIFLFTFLLFVR